MPANQQPSPSAADAKPVLCGCGGHAIHEFDPDAIAPYGHVLTCSRCASSTGSCRSKEQAVQSWNTARGAVEAGTCEREHFEQTIKGRSLGRYATDNYIDPYVAGAWFGWQAKAASEPARSDQQPVAITKADHLAGEVGYCEFLRALPFETQLFAAPQRSAVESEELTSDTGLQAAEERLKLVFESPDEEVRLEALAYWLEQQRFRPEVLSIAAADLRALFKRAQEAQDVAPTVAPAWNETVAQAGFSALERRGFRVGASDLGMDDLKTVFYSMLSEAVTQGLHATEGLEEALKRLSSYIDERGRVRGLDPDGIHELHAGTERECSVRVSDIRSVIAALATAC